MFQSPDDLKDPRANALLHKSFEGIPPCLFIVAELDPLRDGNLGMECYWSLDRSSLPSFRISEAT